MIPPPLGSQAVADVLGVMAINPERQFFTRELEHLTGRAVRGVVVALNRLMRDEVVHTARAGGRPAYVINADNPYFPELQRIALKSLGVPEALDAVGVTALKVAIYGSFARGEAGPASDLDVLVIGAEPEVGAAAAALSAIGTRVGRELSVQLYLSAEYQRQRDDTGSFIASVLGGPVLELRGRL